MVCKTKVIGSEGFKTHSNHTSLISATERKLPLLFSSGNRLFRTEKDYSNIIAKTNNEDMKTGLQ